MTENNQTIATLHNLLDYDARKFTSAEIQLKKQLTGMDKQSQFFTTKDCTAEVS